MNDDLERSRREWAEQITDFSARNDAYWDGITAGAKAILGPHFPEFKECFEMAVENRNRSQQDPFVRNYMNDRTRPDHLVLCRRLLAQHREVMLRGI